MLDGRPPANGDEIALGRQLLDRLHARIGSRVTLSVKGGEFDAGGRTRDHELTVVGVAVAPVMGESEFGQVGVVTLDAIEAAGGNPAPSLVLARFRDDDHAAAVRALRHDTTAEILVDNVPSRIVNLHRVRSLLLVGGGIAALLGTALLVYTLAVSARSRDRDLAILRALGMTARDVGRALTAQGALLALAMLVVGIPFGVALGTFTWRTVAHQLGVLDRPTFVAALALLVPAALLVGIAASLGPARRARRRRVGPALRVE
jgi:predicted lysophospholipase L1 biosynthesis ABC-type transport system permease subunit